MNLVVGATGTLGGRVTRGLLAAGEEVRILVRQDSPSTELAQIGLATPAAALIEAGAQPFLGDLRDAASLEAACAGVNTVFTTATATKREATDTIMNQTISFIVDVTSPISANVFPYVQTLEIIGGTGRFAGASGCAVVEGVINLSTFAYDGQVNGAFQKAGGP